MGQGEALITWLHVYKGKCTKMIVYNIKRCPKRGDGRKDRVKEILRNKTLEGKIPNTWLYYSG